MASNSTDEKGLLMNLYYRYCNGERNFSENEWLQIVKKDGYAIRSIKNPSEEVQLIAVKQNGNSIHFIENPSEKVQLEAVKEDVYAVQFIKNPSEEIQLEAIKTIDDIYYINNYITNKKVKQKWRQIQQMKKSCL